MFKIGDKVEFKISDEHREELPDTYTIYKIVQGYSAPLIYFTLRNGCKSGGYYQHRLLLSADQTTRDKYQDVINKIKYLDKMYHDRKQLATNTSS